MIHFCSVDLAESSMKEAHRKLISMAIDQGKLVSFDPNLRFSLWDDLEELRQTVREFMKFADVIKISDEELEFITGCKTIEAALPDLLAHRAEYVVYTMGQDGAAVYTRNGMVQVPGYSVQVGIRQGREIPLLVHFYSVCCGMVFGNCSRFLWNS